MNKVSSSESIPSQPSDASKQKLKKPVLRGPVAQRRRRTSTWRSRESGSFIGHGGRYDKTSTDLSIGKKLPVRKENTYQLEPDQKFQYEKAEQIIREVLTQNLSGKTYDGTTMGGVARMLSDVIKERIKTLKADRFKIISYVTICERHNFDMKMVSRCLWDAEFDTFASATFENSTLNAVGMVFAVYQE